MDTLPTTDKERDRALFHQRMGIARIQSNVLSSSISMTVSERSDDLLFTTRQPEKGLRT